MTVRLGDVVEDRYELLSVAGEGGMGVVFRAWDRASHRDVALKVMRSASSAEAGRFGREARVLRSLSHPGIVGYVADGVSATGELWLAMDWLEGEDLSTRLRRGPLSGDEAIEVARGIADALAHAHARGLVHRDLKPSNVWLVQGNPTRHGVRLLDFGTVRRLDPNVSIRPTRAGAMIGTPGYLAPEQARGELDVELSADVYALGCILFECISGRPAFEGEHALALLAKVLIEPAPRLASTVVVPDAIDVLVSRMLSKDRAGRPRDGGEVAIALDTLGRIDVGELPPPVSRPSLMREQRWLCVLLVRAPAVSVDENTQPEDAPELTAVACVAAESGARLEHLAGGAQVLLWQTSDAPAELAVRAARAALAIRAIVQWPSALVTGRAAIDGAVPVGQALDRAAEIALGSRDRVVIDASIAPLLAERFELAPNCEWLELVGERSRVVEAGGVAGRKTPFVGRGVELAMLHATLAQVVEERSASVVVLTGALGSGKSRVRHAWVQTLATTCPDAQVWMAHADATHAHATYGVAARLVLHGCGVPFGASRDVVRARIRAAVARVVEPAAQRRIASRLCELGGAPWERDLDDGLVLARQDAVVMGDQLRAAWEDFLVASCSTGPVVLIVEDLQWADASSLALIDRALRNFGDRRWMVLGVGRPECRTVHPNLWSERGPRELVLGPLRDAAIERIARAVLPDAVAQERVAWLVSRASGNVFVLEELLRAELDARGAETPETILAMVESRMLRLDPALRRVLRAASVYGNRFDARGVEAVLAERLPRSAFDALVVDDWLIAVEGEGYAFRQALSTEAAYAMLVDDDRRLAHRRAALWLAGSAADPVVTAEHFERAGEPEHAGPWWARAATQALEANDFVGCVARAEAAHRCGAVVVVLAEALAAKIEAHSWLDENLALLEGAERLRALAVGLPEHEANALRWEALGSHRAGDQDRILGAVARVTALAEAHPASDSIVFYALRIANFALGAGLVAPADALVTALDSLDPPLAARGLRVLAAVRRWRSARALQGHEPPDVALRLVRESVAQLRAVGDLRFAASEEVNFGFQLVLYGAYAEAARALEASLAECSRLGLSYAIAGARHNLGLALLGLGRFGEALAAERAATEAFARQGNRMMECACREYSARILVAAGRADDAVTECEGALTLLPDEHPLARMVKATLADALLVRCAPGDAARAMVCADAARAALRDDPAQFEDPAYILRVHLDALRAGGFDGALRAAREEAHAWVRELAGRIQSAPDRDVFLRSQRDVVRILSHG